MTYCCHYIKVKIVEVSGVGTSLLFLLQQKCSSEEMTALGSCLDSPYCKMQKYTEGKTNVRCLIFGSRKQNNVMHPRTQLLGQNGISVGRRGIAITLSHCSPHFAAYAVSEGLLTSETILQGTQEGEVGKSMDCQIFVSVLAGIQNICINLLETIWTIQIDQTTCFNF